MKETNPHIVALRSAEQELREHDKRIADAAAELKDLKAERRELAARVAQCIDVLCGRTTPTLFDETEQPDAQQAAIPTPPSTDMSPKGDASDWRDLVPIEPEGVQYPATDDWRKQGLALLGLNEKLLKACKREEVFTVGELHDWIDEETREEGGFFGHGVLAKKLAEIGKIAAKWGESNAEILFQFCADHGFIGVPE